MTPYPAALSVGSGCAIDAGLAPAFAALFSTNGANARADAQVSRELGCGQTEASAKATKGPAFNQKPGNRQPLRRLNSGSKPAPGPRQNGPTTRSSKPEISAGRSTLPQPSLECDNQEDRSSKAGANSDEVT